MYVWMSSTKSGECDLIDQDDDKIFPTISCLFSIWHPDTSTFPVCLFSKRGIYAFILQTFTIESLKKPVSQIILTSLFNPLTRPEKTTQSTAVINKATSLLRRYEPKHRPGHRRGWKCGRLVPNSQFSEISQNWFMRGCSEPLSISSSGTIGQFDILTFSEYLYFAGIP
jgi:hypothetical protein